MKKALIICGLLTLVSFIIGMLQKKEAYVKIGKEIGLFALIWGVFGQVIGLIDAFHAIESAGQVSQGLLAGGLRVSSYTTAYGLFIFLISVLLRIVALNVLNKESNNQA